MRGVAPVETIMRALEDPGAATLGGTVELRRPLSKNHREIPDDSQVGLNGNWGMIPAKSGPLWFAWT